MHYDPSDLGSLILIWIIPKEHVYSKVLVTASMILPVIVRPIDLESPGSPAQLSCVYQLNYSSGG